DTPGYVPVSDLEEELEEDDEDPEEDPADYPADRDDDNDDDEDEDKDEEEEEEHPASADSILPVHRMTARISIRDKPSVSLPLREEVERLLVLTTPPPSPLTPLSSPLPLPTSSPPLYEIGESSAAAATRPIGGRRADYGFVGTMDTEIRRQRAEEVGYGIRDVWVVPREAIKEVTQMTLEGVNARVTELTAVQEQDTQDIYAVIGDTQDRQTQIYQSVETLFDDKVSYMTRSEIMALRSVVMGQQAADRRSQMAEFQRQHGPAKGLAQPDVPGEAGSSS
ncbi:hypothetical protein Tco_1535655, partial [Tanacetum coccineum]